MSKDLELLKDDVKKMMLKDWTKTEVEKLSEFMEDVIIATMLVNKLPIHVVATLPNVKSKEFLRWTQSKGYEPAFNGLWYEKNSQTYNTDVLHRAFTNEIEFGN